MKAEAIAAYCLSKYGATEDYPFGPSPMVLKVGGKMFALISWDRDGLQVSLKCEPDIAARIREENPSVRPGYHLNKKHWNTVYVDNQLEDGELKAMIDHSYELVVKGLPKVKRQPLEWRL